MILSLHECWCQKELTSLIGGKVRIPGPPGTPSPWIRLCSVKEHNIVSFVYYRYVLNKYSED